MRTLILTIALILVSLPLLGGEMCVVKTKADADVIVYVTENQWEAHLWVCTTDIGTYAQHSDSYWKFVNYKNGQTVKVYFTKSKYEADIIISYSQYQHGWRKPNQFQGRLH